MNHVVPGALRFRICTAAVPRRQITVRTGRGNPACGSAATWSVQAPPVQRCRRRRLLVHRQHGRPRAVRTHLPCIRWGPTRDIPGRNGFASPSHASGAMYSSLNQQMLQDSRYAVIQRPLQGHAAAARCTCTSPPAARSRMVFYLAAPGGAAGLLPSTALVGHPCARPSECSLDSCCVTTAPPLSARVQHLRACGCLETLRFAVLGCPRLEDGRFAESTTCKQAHLRFTPALCSRRRLTLRDAQCLKQCDL